MTSPELEQLLAELRDEKPVSHVAVHRDGKMVIVIEETSERHEIKADDAKLILSSRGSVTRLFEALDYPEETFIELHGIEVDAEVMAELESFASTVDEM